jgi:hypothetical protein
MGVLHSTSPPEVSRSGLILPIEDGKWIVSIAGRHGDDPPGDFKSFMAFVKTFRTPTIYNAIKNAKPVGDVARYNLPASIRRHFDRLERFPRGLIPIGDSVCRFNPVFGQGMSVAAMEAVVLGEQLQRRGGHANALDGLAEDYLADIQDCLEAPWATAETLRLPSDARRTPAGPREKAPVWRRAHSPRCAGPRRAQDHCRGQLATEATKRAARARACEAGDGFDGGGSLNARGCAALAMARAPV